MCKSINSEWIKVLWETYCENLKEAKILTDILKSKGANLIFDHLAFIDLPGKYSGIPVLQKIFSYLGFIYQGEGYLPEKQNSFLWMAESGCYGNPAYQAFPQIVIADFKCDELNKDVRQIVEKYASYIKPIPYLEIENWIKNIKINDQYSKDKLINWLCKYFRGGEWPRPTYKEFQIVKEQNELLAWVLIFGRRPNHFTFAIHHMGLFHSLEDFNAFIETIDIKLNRKGGIIKGNFKTGIAQSSTSAPLINIKLEGGPIQIPSFFIEFVWRFTNKTSGTLLWEDYYTGFIGKQADHVVESLYKN